MNDLSALLYYLQDKRDKVEDDRDDQDRYVADIFVIVGQFDNPDEGLP